ncbi:hypothetical protein ACIO8F_08065 [Streptomyces sp. NPDC087228]|uniref:hypothetical protein n=1 Tax=Streptomyces sp. NPDC087228 TaxID=3365772 RepID=UPI00380D466A
MTTRQRPSKAHRQARARAAREERSESLLVLLARLDRGPLTEPERALLRTHVDAETAEAGHLRRTIAGQQATIHRQAAQLDAAHDAIREAEQYAIDYREQLHMYRAVEEQAQQAADAEQRAEKAEQDARIYRNRLTRAIEATAAHIASEATLQRQIDEQAAELDRTRDRAEQAEQDAERYKADHLAACRTIAEMHEAATGRTGMGPVRGVVEDVADVRERAEKRGDHWKRVAQVMEADRDHEAATREQAQQDAKEAKEQARVAHVAAHRLMLRTPEAAERTLGRVREARSMGDIWTILGMHYGLTPEQAGQEARARRSTAERAAEAAARVGTRHMADADRYRAAWRSARHRANIANDERHAEQAGRTAAETLAARARKSAERVLDYADALWESQQKKITAATARAEQAEATLASIRDLARGMRAGSPQGAAAIYADRIEQALDTTPEQQ